MPQPSLTPPRWPLAVLRAALPRDAVGDAIVGDLHEEFVHDAARLGASRARGLYRRRVASVVTRAVLDELCLRTWASDAPAVAPPRVVGTPRVAVHAVSSRVRMGAELGVGALAFAVLGIGIVVNTVLFAAVRGAPRPATGAGPALPSAIGVGAAALALVCAGLAAVVLCAGPRWLRRRFLHGVPPAAE